MHRKLMVVGATVSLMALCGFGIAFALKFKIVRVTGRSMEPTLPDGTWLLARKAPGPNKAIHRGDLVVARVFDSGESTVVKRVGGMPGDFEGAFDPILKERAKYGYGDFSVKEGNYFLLGDDPERSVDSREFGPVETSDILAKCYEPVTFFTAFPYLIPMGGVGLISANYCLLRRLKRTSNRRLRRLAA